MCGRSDRGPTRRSATVRSDGLRYGRGGIWGPSAEVEFAADKALRFKLKTIGLIMVTLWSAHPLQAATNIKLSAFHAAYLADQRAVVPAQSGSRAPWLG